MFYDPFITYLQSERRFSTHTVTAYKNDVLSFLAFKENLSEQNEITGNHIRQWLVSLMENEAAATTVNRKLSSLKTYYKFLLREGVIQTDPAQLISILKKPKQLPVTVGAEKLSVLLDSGSYFADDFEGLRDRLIIELLFGTGIRLSELIGLTHDSVHRYEKAISVLGKRNKQRIVPLNSELFKLLELYEHRRNEENFDNNSFTLIVTIKGKPAYEKMIYRIVNKYIAEISTQTKRSPHILRHSFATELLNNGAELNAIKELLGHSSLAATQVYTHNSVERLKSIYKQAHPKA